MKKPKNGKTMLAAMPQDAQAAARRLAKKHGTTPAEEVARVGASMERVCRRGNAERDIGVPKATPAQVRKAVRKLAQVRGCTVAQVLADERKAHARASGRGKLYHADIMGEEFMQAREAEAAEAARQGHPVPRPLRPREALRMARRAAELEAQLAAEREDHALDMASIRQTIGAELGYERQQRHEAEAQRWRLVKRIDAAQMAAADVETPPDMEWVSIRVVAQRLGISPSGVRARSRKGALGLQERKKNPAVKQSGHLYLMPKKFKGLV